MKKETDNWLKIANKDLKAAVSFIAVRYPDDIEKVELKFQKEKTKEILGKVKDIYKWLKKQINQT